MATMCDVMQASMSHDRGSLFISHLVYVSFHVIFFTFHLRSVIPFYFLDSFSDQRIREYHYLWCL